MNEYFVSVDQLCSALRSQLHPHSQALGEEDIIRVAHRDVVRLVNPDCSFNAIIDRRAGAAVLLPENLEIWIGFGQTLQDFRGGILSSSTMMWR